MLLTARSSSSSSRIRGLALRRCVDITRLVPAPIVTTAPGTVPGGPFVCRENTIFHLIDGAVYHTYAVS